MKRIFFTAILLSLFITGPVSAETLHLRSGTDTTQAWTGSEPNNPYRGTSWPNYNVEYRDTETDMWGPVKIIGEHPAWPTWAPNIEKPSERTYVWSPSFSWGYGGWRTFKTEFYLPDSATNINASMISFVDNFEKIYVNGNYLGNRLYNYYGQDFTSGGWWLFNDLPHLKPGKNVIEFICYDEGGSGVGKLFDLTIDYGTNTPPSVTATDNLFVLSSDVSTTTIGAISADSDGDTLTYRWLDGDNELLPSTPVGPNGEANLVLSQIAALPTGTHTLTVEVSDGTATASAETILTIGNSPPNVTIGGGATIQIGDTASVTGTVSDFDGDSISFNWYVDGILFSTGLADAVYGGTPVDVPGITLDALTLGDHPVVLQVSDSFNEPVSADTTITVIDTVAPTIAPVASPSILWPPNHQLVDVVITANASDNAGGPVTLNASVSSSELSDSLGDGTSIPDIVGPVIDQAAGTITFQLRSERSGKGNGRTYTVIVSATDESGNTSEATINIMAPHDIGKK